MKRPVYALIDCNNFYVSCERIFKPELDRCPVAVLSNNDGIIVSRSAEVKALGVPMGAPLFKWRHLVNAHGIRIFSSNYELYGDISRRVMDTLMTFTDNIEIYSIDEAFLRLENQVIPDHNSYGREIKERVKKWTGIPVSVGIASTKTLAKAANELAKKDPDLKGVLSFAGLPQRTVDDYLKKVEAEDVWGIGRQYTKMLKNFGIDNAYDFKELPEAFVREKMTVMGVRTLLELKGESCIPLEETVDPKKGIVSSRTFGRLVTDLKDLKESVSTYTTRACEKLRQQNSKAKRIEVFVTTNRFRERDKQYYASTHRDLPMHSDSTQVFINEAMEALKRIYRPGYNYKKAGVYLTRIVPVQSGQLAMFGMEEFSKASVVSRIVDEINSRYGKESVIYASSGLGGRHGGMRIPGRSWLGHSDKKSKRFTTRWDELFTVG